MTSYIEAMIEQAEDENRLFESVLHMQFRKAQVLKEADEGDATEATNVDDNTPAEAPKADAATKATDAEGKKKWFEKIKEIATKAWESIKRFFGTIIAKIKEVVLKDKTIVTKYEAALKDPARLKGFVGIRNFAPADLTHTLIQPANMVDDLIASVVSRDALWDEDFGSKCDELIKECNKCIQPNNRVDVWNKDGSANYDFSKAIQILSQTPLNEYLSTYKKIANTPADKIIKKGLTIGGNANGEESVSIGGKVADIQGAPEKISKLSQAVATFLRTSVAYIKAIRVAIIACGTAAIKGATNESANDLAWVAQVASEQFIDEQFAFI